jgi:FKBP-type peptidyl-prolyl cis-trans isomerase
MSRVSLYTPIVAAIFLFACNPSKKIVVPAPVETIIVKDTVAVVQPLLSMEDSASYAIGLSVVNFYKSQGFMNINSSIVARAINDAREGKQLLQDNEANNVVMNYLNKISSMKAKPTIDSGEAFLAQNKTRAGVTTTASGLQYEVLTQGKGPRPTITDTVVCHYRGTFLNGSVFDESYSRGQPISFPVTGVIKGWTEVLQLMPAGSKYKVYVPYQLGYGASDYGPIPGGSMLTFEIELLEVKPKR